MSEQPPRWVSEQPCAVCGEPATNCGDGQVNGRDFRVALCDEHRDQMRDRIAAAIGQAAGERGA